MWFVKSRVKGQEVHDCLTRLEVTEVMDQSEYPQLDQFIESVRE
jgi:hypothetical protein